jgi:sigma-B regulation protein RsbU (phosphoserine phosphatase)
MGNTVSPDQIVYDLEEKLDNSRAQLRDLATMGTVVTSIHEIDAVLSVVMDMSIRLVEGEVGLILLHDEGQLKPSIGWGLRDDFAHRLRYDDDHDLLTWVLENRRPAILNELGHVDRTGVHVQSLLCLPIKTSDEVLGIILIVNKADGGLFDEGDLEALDILTNFAAVAIDNSNLLKNKLKQQEHDRELAIAQEIQRTILPQELSFSPDLEIGAAYFPMGEVGGDFYDVVPLDDNRLIAILGDVSSHGVPAALVMSAASGIIKTILAEHQDITVSDLAARLNDLLAKEIIKDREMYVTMFFCLIDLEKRRLTYCNAGHLPGLFWSEEMQAIQGLTVGGPIIGQFPGMEFKQAECALNSLDRLFLFTDGLTEAADASGNLFGRERAEQVFLMEGAWPPDEFCLRVKEWVDKFSEGSAAETHDDFTVLQMRVK